MPADPELVNNVAGNLLSGTSAGHLRRERFADESASSLLVGATLLLEKARHNFTNISDLTLNQIISDQTGSDSALSERILISRAVQDQPQQGTMSDPNYRGGASAPTPPPSATKSV